MRFAVGKKLLSVERPRVSPTGPCRIIHRKALTYTWFLQLFREAMIKRGGRQVRRMVEKQPGQDFPDQESPILDETVGDGAAGVEQYHGDLYRIAQRELRRHVRSGTIDTVALVNEAYLRVHKADSRWENRAHFLASMTTTMRNVLVDYARERNAQCRGGDWLQVTGSALDALRGSDCPVDLVMLDQAMQDLGQRSTRLERIVELKIFGGLTIDEMADAMEVSTATISRELRVASAFLRRALAA